MGVRGDAELADRVGPLGRSSISTTTVERSARCAHCGAVVVEAFTDLTSRALARSREIGVGEQITFASDHVHEVYKQAGEPALTLHGYSPRLSQMTFYDHSEPSFLAPVETVRFDEPPRLALASVAGDSSGQRLA